MLHSEVVQFGRYKLLERQSSSARGDIHSDNHSDVGGFVRDLVLVSLSLESCNDPMLVEHFIDSTKAAARLNHKNIARIIDIGSERGRLFLCRSATPGGSVAELLMTARGLGISIPAPQALYIALRVIEALAHAHRQAPAVLHRGLDGTRVVVSSDGEVKVTGFGGESLVTRPPTVVAPEIGAGHGHDKRSDVFACGRVLDQCMRVSDARDGHVVTRIGSIAHRAMSPDRALRHADAGELFEDLRTAINELGLVSTRHDLAAWLADSASETDPVAMPVGGPRLARGSTNPPIEEDEPAVPIVATPPRAPTDDDSGSLTTPVPTVNFHQLQRPATAPPTSSGWPQAVITLAVALLLFAASVSITIALGN